MKYFLFMSIDPHEHYCEYPSYTVKLFKVCQFLFALSAYSFWIGEIGTYLGQFEVGSCLSIHKFLSPSNFIPFFSIFHFYIRVWGHVVYYFKSFIFLNLYEFSNFYKNYRFNFFINILFKFYHFKYCYIYIIIIYF